MCSLVRYVDAVWSRGIPGGMGYGGHCGLGQGICSFIRRQFHVQGCWIGTRHLGGHSYWVLLMDCRIGRRSITGTCFTFLTSI